MSTRVAAAVPSINLKFQDPNGTECHFKLKPTTKLEKAMKAYAKRTARDVKTLRFYFEGERVNGDDTAEKVRFCPCLLPRGCPRGAVSCGKAREKGDGFCEILLTID